MTSQHVRTGKRKQMPFYGFSATKVAILWLQISFGDTSKHWVMWLQDCSGSACKIWKEDVDRYSMDWFKENLQETMGFTIKYRGFL